MEYFVWPFVFILLPLPFLIRLIFSRVESDSSRQADIIALRVPFFNQVQSFTTSGGNNKITYTRWPLILMWLFLICAGARPVLFSDMQTLPQNARNIVLTIDASGSMAEQDFDVNGHPISRFDLVKAVVSDFIQKRVGDEISLVVFGSEAYTYTPLTYDIKTLQSLLKEINVGMAGEMTAIGDALATGVANVSKLPADSRVVILLSDGNTNAGVVQVAEALEMAKKTGVKVYTIGIGSAPKEMRSFLGFKQMVNPAADLDEETLKQIAQLTGGQYFRAKTTSELQAIYEIIDALETSEQDEQVFRPRKELFFIPLLGALICFLIAWYKRRGQ